MQYLIATTFEVVHYIALQAVHYKPLQEVHLSRYNHRIIRQECSLAETHPLATIEEIQHTAILLFAEYLDAATSMATSSGGGGNTDSNGWGRDKDDDDREWARRCARMANSMCKQRKGLKR